MNNNIIFRIAVLLFFIFCVKIFSQDSSNSIKNVSVLELKNNSMEKGKNINTESTAEDKLSGTDADALNKKITELEEEINKLKSSFEASIKKETAPPLFSIKVGFLAQVHAQTIQEQTSAVQDANPLYNPHWQRQIYVRRLRILLGGDIAKNTSFFFDADAPNLGKVSTSGAKDAKISMYVQDAQVQHSFIPELSIIAGLQLVGISRNALQSSAALMGLDYGAYQFAASAPLDNSAGRDLGINLRGFLFGERLEYRSGFFSGRNINQYSPLRFTSRLQYNFKDIEKGFYYSGTTLSKGDVLSLGCGTDLQGTYRAYSFDAMYDSPLLDYGSITLSASISHLNGGGSDKDSTVFTGLIPKQTVFFTEIGYFLKDINLQPYLRYENQDVHADVLKQVGATEANLALKNKLMSSQRAGFGINYFINGHNANIKILYELILRNRISAEPGASEKASNGMLTLQFQYFTF